MNGKKRQNWESERSEKQAMRFVVSHRFIPYDHTECEGGLTVIRDMFARDGCRLPTAADEQLPRVDLPHRNPLAAGRSCVVVS